MTKNVIKVRLPKPTAEQVAYLRRILEWEKESGKAGPVIRLPKTFSQRRQKMNS